MPERDALLQAAAKLEAATEDLGNKFARVDTFAHETARAHTRTRDLTYLVIAGLVIELLIIVVLAVTNDKANDANSRSVRTQEYQRANCEATNEARAANRQLWSEVTALIGRGGAGGEQFANRVMAKVNATYVDRDCSKVAEGLVR